VPEPFLVDTTVWHLELDELQPSSATAEVVHAAVPFGPLNKLFYDEIGQDFDWSDKSGWDTAKWQAWAEKVELWIVLDHGTPGGYAELLDKGDQVELVTFGLLAPFRGRGLGGALLTRAIERAVELAEGRRVTVQTCSLDGPAALPNYQARGFRIARETVERRLSTRR
jgi:GNAT superfamily N-acetyltransferase